MTIFERVAGVLGAKYDFFVSHGSPKYISDVSESEFNGVQTHTFGLMLLVLIITSINVASEILVSCKVSSS